MPIQQRQALNYVTNQARSKGWQHIWSVHKSVAGNTYGQYTKVWLAIPKADVLDGDVDGFLVFGVLKIVGDFLEKLIKVKSHRLSEHCMQGLPSYIEHIVKPVATACCPGYERLWRVQRPNMVEARVGIV